MKKLAQILVVAFGLMWLGGCNSTSTASYTVGGNAKGTVNGVVLLNKTLHKKSKIDVGSGDGNYDHSDCEPEPFRPDNKLKKSLSKTWSEGDVEYTSTQEKLTLKKEGSFAFAKKYESDTEYNVTILSQPDDTTCTLKNNVGTVGSIDVNSIILECVGGTPPPDDDNNPPKAVISSPHDNDIYNCYSNESMTSLSLYDSSTDSFGSINIDGNASSDPDGDSLTYKWSTKSGSQDLSSVINGSNDANATIPLDGICKSLNDSTECDSYGRCKVHINLKVSDGKADDNASVVIYLNFPT